MPRTATKDIYRKKHLKEGQVLFEVHLRQRKEKKRSKFIKYFLLVVTPEGLGEILDSYANPQLRFGFTTVSSSRNPSREYTRFYKHGKRFLLLK